MASKFFLLLLISFSFYVYAHPNSNSSLLASAAMEMPHHSSFNSVSASDCNHPSHSTLNSQERNTHNYLDSNDVVYDDDDDEKPILPAKNYKKSTVKVPLRRRASGQNLKPKDSVVDSAARDIARIQTLYTRIIDKKNQNTVSRMNKATPSVVDVKSKERK